MQGEKMGEIMKNITGYEVSVQYTYGLMCVVNPIAKSRKSLSPRALRPLV